MIVITIVGVESIGWQQDRPWRPRNSTRGRRRVCKQVFNKHAYLTNDKDDIRVDDDVIDDVIDEIDKHAGRTNDKDAMMM